MKKQTTTDKLKTKLPPFKSYKDVIDAGCLKVQIIEDDTEDIITKLGITVERAKELHKIGKEAFDSSKAVVETMVKASSYCKHANELAYMMVELGLNLSQVSNQGPTDIGAIMQRIVADIKRRRANGGE